MLIFSVVDKCKSDSEISNSSEENLSKHFPSFIENYKYMFSANPKSSRIENMYAPACASNNHFATNKRLISKIEKNKR